MEALVNSSDSLSIPKAFPFKIGQTLADGMFLAAFEPLAEELLLG